MKTTIRKRLNQLGMDAVWLSEQTGIHANTIRKWISDDDSPASLVSMRLIADALRVRISDLWPNIKDEMDWEHRFNVITDQLEHVHYKSREFTYLCRERAAASVHCYIRNRRKTVETYMQSYNVAINDYSD